MKKLLAIILCLTLCCGVLALGAFAEEAKYYVAGSGGLVGQEWVVNGAQMTKSGDIYTITFSNVQPGNYEFKVTDGTWDNCWPGQNYSFAVETACDVTVTFDPATKEIKVSGSGLASGVKAPAIQFMALRGEGNENLSWGEDLAKMSKVSEGIYEYTISNVAANSALKFKFTANGNWDDYNFGGTYSASGQEAEAVWKGNDIYVSVAAESNVTIKLDLTGLEYKADSKLGATFTVTVTPVDGESGGEPEVPTGMITVHAKVPADWGAANAYVWDGGSNNAWPGTAMTQGDDGWYTVQVPAWAKNLIINNGNGSQTNDLALESAGEVWVTVEAVEGGFAGTVSYEAPDDTGDPIAVVAALLAASMMGMAIVGKKKF